MNRKTLTLVSMAALAASSATYAAGKSAGGSEALPFHGACVISLASSGTPRCSPFALEPGQQAEIQTVAVRCSQIMSDPSDGYPVIDANLTYPSVLGMSKFGIPLTFSFYDSVGGTFRFQTGVEHGPFYAENTGVTQQEMWFSINNLWNPIMSDEWNSCRFEIHGLIN